ncbi:hypothetical protein GCM10011607_12010 [Shewanella inventionis]|uniref:Uncharacterized protein n=1 Tax=Shewanella inventionis TaxID=1738770 RepID=A0ABQ1IWN9_9GAMM|nr:hypothetical protein [Shewanella inventionis]GGB53091.1 hypothetical protein GCM10011607_12010 [Shewanella inventionis]
MINLTVPFVYEAVIIKPRCRKPSLIAIKDKVQVQIKTTTLDKLPIAFKVGDIDLRWDGERLWDYYLESVAKEPKRKVGVDELIKNTQNDGSTYRYSRPGAAAPFKNCWMNLKWSNAPLGVKHNINDCGFDKWISDDDVHDKSEVNYREWVEDNRDVVVALVNKIANGILIIDGTLFSECNEPRYEVCSFGAGHNYSVAMFVTFGYNPNLSSDCYFRADDFYKAQESLLKRDPDKNKIPEPNDGHRIEVFIPEALRCNPKYDHVA